MPRVKTRGKATKKTAKKKATAKKEVKVARKTKAKKKEEDLSPAEAFIRKVSSNAHYRGKAQIKMASEARTTYLLRRPTGILGLDIALGGGFHAGGAVEVHGAESAGKTTLVFRAAGEVQRNYGEDTNILIYCTEINPDKGLARLNGFVIPYSEEEIAEYALIRELSGEPAFTEEELADLRFGIGNVLIHAAATADIGLDLVLDALDSGIFQLVIIESLGAFLTKDADDGYTGDRHYAGASQVVTTFQNQAYPKFIMDRLDGSKLETTIVGINQARANIGGGNKAPSTKAAMNAFAWKHGQLASVQLERGKGIRENEKSPITGREIRWRLTKGKAGTHDGKNGKYDFYFPEKRDPVFWRDVQEEWLGGIDTWSEAADTAKALGLLDISGSWIKWRGIKGQGAEQFAEKLAADPEHQKLIWADCMRVARVSARYT
jgi:RecA/RadA recombinase